MLRYVKSYNKGQMYVIKIIEDLMGNVIHSVTVVVKSEVDYKWDDPEILFNKYCNPLDRTIEL